ncbi:MerR family transcriptional regulator [Paracoccaceae bacterium GXU_MW_L88]
MKNGRVDQAAAQKVTTSSQEELGIGEMCEAYDVTARALRFYESKGLLAPRRIGAKRLYGRRDRARLQLILQGKRFGFALDEIGELFMLYDDGLTTEQQRRALALGKERLDVMKDQYRELGEAITDLESRISQAETRLRAN